MVSQDDCPRLDTVTTWAGFGNTATSKLPVTNGHILYDSIYTTRTGDSVEPESGLVVARGWAEGFKEMERDR